MFSETRYAYNGDLALAYRTAGAGPRDFVYVANWYGNVEVSPLLPGSEGWMQQLLKLGRLTFYDQAGTGASDPISLEELPSLEQWTDSITAVMDEVDIQEAVLICNDSGFFTASMFAATYPQRTTALVSLAGWPRVLADDGFPGYTKENWDAGADAAAKMWGTGEWQHFINPDYPWSEERRAAWAQMERLGASPGMFRRLATLTAEFDVRDILPTIRVPTLVLHSQEDRLARVEIGQYIASRIPGAQFEAIPGRNHYLFIEPGWRPAIEKVIEFLTGEQAEEIGEDRVLATVLFTDIVDSTKRAAELGDRDWRALLDAHDAVVRAQLARFRGREVKTTGDGFMATFDGPQRAIKCTIAVRDALQPLGVEIRAGLHTGECEVRGDDVGGIAVHIGARVSALAGGGEVLVSGTLRDLVVGSGLTFEDRGARELKGVPGEWRLYAVSG